jgi:hypothetical protein
VHKFDLIWISEIKTSLVISVPGFMAFHNVDPKSSHRGGIVLLVKQNLVKWISRVQMMHSQIWITLEHCSKLLLGGCYLPPNDSIYHDASILGDIQVQMMSTEGQLPILLGDLNARMWNPEALNELWTHEADRYRNLVDHTVNENGRMILQLCRDTECIVINHLKNGEREFPGGLSYRQGRTWVSELDVCITAKEAVSAISNFRIESSKNLPSDHAPLELEINLSQMRRSTNLLVRRSSALGEYMDPPLRGTQRKGPAVHKVNTHEFRNLLMTMPAPLVANQNEINEQVSSLNHTLNSIARQTPARRDQRETLWGPQHGRWKRLIDTGDARTIWRAIGWNGCLNDQSNEQMPSDVEFKTHFESLLMKNQTMQCNTENCPYVPLLDDEFSPVETERAIKCLKEKSFSGVCAGLFKCLPLHWIIYLTQLFSVIFANALYPDIWTHNPLVVLFKSGLRSDCGNYRGISIMDTAAKLYDNILNSRLSSWIDINKAQAGAQKGRGCIEQILTLRLLMDYAKTNKKKLFILFVDFKKAYDMVDRHKLLQVLESRGCGKNMLAAIAAVYKSTKFILRSAIVEADAGVRQGAPTSCLLFVLYIDNLVRMLNAQHPVDDFLGTLHALLLMDDTILLATSRQKCLDKLNTLLNFCDQYGMELNQRKTKFMVLNGAQEDRTPLQVQEKVIAHTDHYVYLGAHFVEDGSITKVMTHQAKECEKHLNKFAAFVSKNTNMPFIMKRKVLDACFMSSMLYASESWLTDNLKAMNQCYMAAIKQLLGVRNTTPHLLCLIETGLSDLASKVLKRRCQFMNSFVSRSNGEEPLACVLQLCNGSRRQPNMYRKLLAAQRYVGDPEAHARQCQQEECRRLAASSSRFATYQALNPELEVHGAYSSTCGDPDFKHREFSRFRLSAHRVTEFTEFIHLFKLKHMDK